MIEKVKRLFFILVLISSSQAQAGQCFWLTSAPDELSKRAVTGDVLYKQYPKLAMPSGKFISFNDAMRDFTSEMISSIKAKCEEGVVAGVINMSVRHNVTQDGYFISASFDYVK